MVRATRLPPPPFERTIIPSPLSAVFSPTFSAARSAAALAAPVSAFVASAASAIAASAASAMAAPSTSNSPRHSRPSRSSRVCPVAATTSARPAAVVVAGRAVRGAEGRQQRHPRQPGDGEGLSALVDRRDLPLVPGRAGAARRHARSERLRHRDRLLRRLEDAVERRRRPAQGQVSFHLRHDRLGRSLSQQGVQYGYGFEVALLAASPPRSAIVAYLEPRRHAGHTNAIARGATIVTVDGVDFANGSDVDTLNAGLFPTAAGTHTCHPRQGASSNRTVTMTAQPITENPVQNVMTLPVPFRNGRLHALQRSHRDGRSRQLVAAIHAAEERRRHRPRARHPLQRRRLSRHRDRAGVHDRRAGRHHVGHVPTHPSTTRYPDTQPGRPARLDDPTPFHDHGVASRRTAGQALPYLGLSARLRADRPPTPARRARPIVNGLRGVGVTVNQIGAHDLRQAVRLLSAGQLRHDLLRDQFQGVNNRASATTRTASAPTAARPPRSRMRRRRRSHPRARRSGGGPARGGTRVSRVGDMPATEHRATPANALALRCHPSTAT